MNNVTAVILAGGIGKRFWPLTIDKALFPFLGKPLISYTIDELKRIGITNILVVTNEKNEEEIKKLSVVTMRQTDPRGMAGALLSANISGACVILNAHDMVSPLLYDQIKKEIEINRPFIVGKKVSEYYDVGYIKKDHDNAIGIVEKPGVGNEPSDLVRLVFDYFPHIQSFTTLLSKANSDKDDLYEQALNTYVKNIPTEAVEYSGNWSPCKYPWHVLDVMKNLINTLPNHKGKNVEIMKNVFIEGNAWIGDNVKIYENTKIIGPCFIGHNTIIGNNTMIRQSHIGANCVVGFDTDITRSYIGDDCWFHSNYIGDSVLEGNIGMGAGGKLANFRLDEQKIASRDKLGAIIASDVRIGINTSIMPGIKIGRNSLIGAGVLLDRDLPDNSFCRAKSTYEVKPNTKEVSSAASRVQFKNSL